MKKRMLILAAAVLSAAGALGYSVKTTRPTFYFEEYTNTNGKVVGEVKTRTTDGAGWLQEDTIYNVTNHGLTSSSQPNFYRIVIVTNGVAVKAWGLSTSMNIADANWLDNTASTNFLCAYDSAYAAVSPVYLYVWLKWMRYGITFESNGGSAVESLSNICYTNSLALPTPSRTGYDFQGWTNGTFTAALTGEQTGAELQVQEDGETVVLYAKWKPQTFTVTFNPNGEGATVDSTETNVTYGSVYGTLPTPVWSGHGFAGWFTDATDGTQIQSNTVVSITANQSLFAHWLPLFTVTFKSTGGTVYKVYTNVEYGSAVDPPDESEIDVPEGKIFDRWSSEGYKNVTGSLTIFPEFRVVETTLNVTCDPTAGGSWTRDDQGAGSYQYGRTVKLTANPNKAYDFAGWSDGSVENPYYVRMITDTNLVARFTLKKFTVDFLDWDGVTTNDTQIVEYGSAADEPMPIEHLGYTFASWNADFSNVTSNMTVVAQYAANRYTVVYDANGGDGSMTNEVFTYGIEYDLQSNDYTRVLYDFLGWASNPNAATNEVEYVDGAAASNLIAVANGTKTLYAVWQSQLSDYSLAADCTNLILVCTNVLADQLCNWDIDSAMWSASPSSVYASGADGNRIAIMTTAVEGTGTLTFQAKGIKRTSYATELLSFYCDENAPLIKLDDTGDRWVSCAYCKTDLAPTTLKWWYVGRSDADACWVDRVHWYPGKRVTVQEDHIDSSVEAEITEAILQNWDAILGENATSVSNVVAKGPAVTNAVALLNSGYRPEIDTSAVPPTLTFNEVVVLDVSISEFSLANLPTATLKVLISPHSALPEVGLWGAPTLTSDWSQVITTVNDSSAFLDEGIVSFEFDVSTNRFFKVITK